MAAATVAPQLAADRRKANKGLHDQRPSCQARRRGDVGDNGAVDGAAASIGNDKSKRLFDAFDFLY